MLAIFEEMQRILRAGCGQTFLLTGNVHDAYPHPKDAQSSELFTLAEVLRMQYPDHLFLQLGLSRGLVALDEEQAKRFNHEVLGIPKPNTGKLDPLSAAIQSASAPIGPVVTPDASAGLAMLHDAFAQDKVKVIVLVPRLETLVASDISHDRVGRTIVDYLLDFAEDDAIARSGHLLVLVAREASSVAEELSGSLSRVVQLRLVRPDEAQRQQFFKRLIVSDEIRAQCEQLRDQRSALLDDFIAAKRESIRQQQEKEKQLKASTKKVAAPDRLVRQSENFKQKIVQLQAEERRLCENFATELPKSVAAAKEQLAKTKRWLATRQMSDKLWQELVVGSRLCGLREPVGLMSYSVTRVHDDGYIELCRSPESAESAAADTADDGETSMTSVAGQADFTGKVLRFTWKAKPGMIFGREIDGSSNVAFYLPDRGPKEHAPNKELYVLRPNESPGDIQAQIDSLTAEEARLVELNEALRRVQSGEPANNELADQVANSIRASETKLEKVEVEIQQAIADKIKEIHEQIAACKKQQQNDEELIADARGPKLVIPIAKQVSQLSEQLIQLQSARFTPPVADLEQLARLSNGLNYRHLRNLLAMADASGYRLDTSTIFKARSKMLTDSFGHLAEVVDARWGFEGIGGLDHIKDELQVAVRNMLNGNFRGVPQGVLFMGPPGTGKSVFAEAIARETGYAYIRVKTLRNMYVGVSEKQTENLLAFVRDAAPIIIERDEVDEEDAGRDSYQGDSGVSARIRRLWMMFMSDPSLRGRVLVLSITNRPDRLDAAMKRSGRNDFRISVLMPDRDARAKIFEVMFDVRYRIATEISDYTEFADLTDGMPGSDIERIALDSDLWAAKDNREVVMAVDIRRAIDDFRPSVEPDVVAKWSQLAIDSTSHVRFLPPEMSDQARKSRSGGSGGGQSSASGEQREDRATLIVVPVAVSSDRPPDSGSAAPPAGNSDLN